MKALALFFAGIGALVAVALLVGGITALATYAFGRDDQGYFTTERHALRSDAYAITTEDIDLGVDEIGWAPDKLLGNVRVQVDGTRPLFVGIGPEDDVERYLRDVARDKLIGFDGDDADFHQQAGAAPRTRPAAEDFWVARSAGSGERVLKWDAEFGRWTLVVMNADAARGVDAEADVGVKLGWALWAGLGMLVLGLLLTAGAVVVIVAIRRRAGPEPAAV